MKKLLGLKHFNVIIFSVLVAVGVIAVAAVVFYSQRNDTQKTVYTVEDFPQAVEVITDPVEIERRVEKINESYRLLGTEGGENDFVHWMNIGILKKTMRDYEGAEAAWQTALLHGRNSVVYGNLASLYYLELDQPKKAIEYYQEAIRINPRNYTYYEDLAGVYRYKLGDDSEAVEAVMLNAAERDPRKANNFYLYLVDYFDSQGSESKMNEYIDTILANNPDEQTLQSLERSGYRTN